MVLVVFESRIVDPGNILSRKQPLCYLLCILTVSLGILSVKSPSPTFKRKEFIGGRIEPRSRISWAVAFVMYAFFPKRSVYTIPW